MQKIRIDKMPNQKLSVILIAGILIIAGVGVYFLLKPTPPPTPPLVDKSGPPEVKWYKTYGGNDKDFAHSLTIVGQNIYVGGTTRGVPNPADIVVLKYDIDGTLLWSKTWDSGSWDVAWPIKGDDSGIYLAGHSQQKNQWDVLLMKYDFSGNLLWNKTWSGSKTKEINENIYNMAINTNQDIYIVGDNIGSYSYDDGSTGISDVIIQKYNSNGNLMWSKVSGTEKWETIEGIAVSDSAIYLGGNIGYPREINPTEGTDVLVQKYDLNGKLLWSKSWGNVGYEDGASSLAIDNTGVYITGFTGATGDSAIGGDLLIQKYDLSGNLLWSETWDSSGGRDAGDSITVTSTGVYVAGGSLNIGAGLDVVVQKYDLNGNLLWSKTWGGNGVDWAFEIVVNGSDIYITGETNSYGAGDFDAFILKMSEE